MPLAQQQMAFGAHLRDPDNVATPAGFDERRVEIYRELVFGNIESLFSSTKRSSSSSH